jgi:hypothetical protein
VTQKTTGHESVNRRTASAMMRGADCRPGAGRSAKPEQDIPEASEFFRVFDSCFSAREFGPVIEYQRAIATRELKGGAE